MLFGKFENETGLIGTKTDKETDKELGRKTHKPRETPEHR